MASARNWTRRLNRCSKGLQAVTTFLNTRTKSLLRTDSGHKEGPPHRVPLRDRNHRTRVQNADSRSWSLSWAQILQEIRKWSRHNAATSVQWIDMGHVLTAVRYHVRAQLLDAPRESHISDCCLEWAGIPTRAAYKEITEVLKNCFSDLSLSVQYIQLSIQTPCLVTSTWQYVQVQTLMKLVDFEVN
jgi:hypothetical protein